MKGSKHRLRVLAVLAAGALAGASQAQTDPDEALISDLVLANRILADQGVLEGFGHVSARSIRDPKHYYVAVAKAPRIVTRADIVEFDENSQPLRPDTRPFYSERFIHGEIYRARPDVKSVVHSHATPVLPFTVTRTPLKAVIHVAYFLGTEPAPVFEIRDAVGEDNGMLVGDAKSGAALARVLGSRAVALMRGHGMAVVGPSLQDSVFRAVYTQVNAQVELEALKLGSPVFLNRFEVNRTERIERAWENWALRIASTIAP